MGGLVDAHVGEQRRSIAIVAVKRDMGSEHKYAIGWALEVAVFGIVIVIVMCDEHATF